MSYSFSGCAVRAIALGGLLVLSSLNAGAADTAAAAAPAMSGKPLAPNCAKGGPMVPVQPNMKVAHQYMMLMVFMKGSGGQYFGNATFDQSGCLGNVAPSAATAKAARAVAPTGTQLYADVCPNDCTGLHEDAATTTTGKPGSPSNKGSDPLGENAWGVLSAVDPATAGPSAENKFEIWQVAVRDGCQARDLYAYHTGAPDRVLAIAKAKGDLLGQILVGYNNPAHSKGPSETCQ
jgi:hypothetical protein